MLKYIKKKVGGGGYSAGKGNDSGKIDQPPALLKFEVNDSNVSRLSDMLEVAVRAKLSDRSSDPLIVVADDEANFLVGEFLAKKTSKTDYEAYSTSTLWSAAVALLSSSNDLLSSDACKTLTMAHQAAKVAGELPLPVQRLLGIVFAAAEMLIRSEPQCSPMVLNALSNAIMAHLPPNSFAATDALVNLLVDHRRLFPSCHTFARKISTTLPPITAAEWRANCTASVAIYGQAAAAASSEGAGAAPPAGPVAMVGLGSDDADTTTSTATGVRSETAAAPPIVQVSASAPASAPTTATAPEAQNKGPGAVRTSFMSELPLNDLTASASVDLSALRSGSSAGAHGIAGGRANPQPQQQAASQGQVTLRQLQEVFSSSLVSSASLDYLAISTIIDDDFADIRTLSGTTKWSMQNQTLADRVTAFRGEGAQKGVISWRDFLRVAEPLLAAEDRAFLATKEGAQLGYDTPLHSAGPPAGIAGAAEAKASATAGVSRSRTIASSRSRSRSGFSDPVSSEESSGGEGDGEGKEEKGGWASAAASSVGGTVRGSQQKAEAKGYPTTATRADAGQHKDWSSRGAGALPQAQSKTAMQDVGDLSDVEEMDLPTTASTGPVENKKVTASKEEARRSASQGQASGKSSVALNKNVRVRRQWEDDEEGDQWNKPGPGRGQEGDDDADISISSHSRSYEVGRASSKAAASRNAPQGRSAQGNNNSRVFELDLLDDSVTSIPLMQQDESTEGAEGVQAEVGEEGGWDRRASGELLKNSFDEEDEAEHKDSRAAEAEEQAQRGPAASSLAPVPAAVQSRDTSQELPDSQKTATSTEASEVADMEGADEGVGGHDVSRLTMSSAADLSETGSAAGSTTQKARKGIVKKAAKGAKKFIRGVFSLTSGSSNNSVASGSVSNASPARHRVDSIDSDAPSVAEGEGKGEGSVQDSGSVTGDKEPKKKGIFGKIAARFSRGRSDSRDSAASAQGADSPTISSSAGAGAGAGAGVGVGEGARAGAGAGVGAAVGAAGVGVAEVPTVPPVATTAASMVADTSAPAGSVAAATVPPAKPPRPSSARNLAPLPATAADSATTSAPRLERSNSVGSDAGSVASSVHTAGTGATADSGDSAKKKKGAPTLRGMAHKTYKMVWGTSKPSLPAPTAGGGDAPAAATGPGDTALAPDSPAVPEIPASLAPPPKPARSPTVRGSSAAAPAPQPAPSQGADPSPADRSTAQPPRGSGGPAAGTTERAAEAVVVSPTKAPKPQPSGAFTAVGEGSLQPQVMTGKVSSSLAGSSEGSAVDDLSRSAAAARSEGEHMVVEAAVTKHAAVPQPVAPTIYSRPLPQAPAATATAPGSSPAGTTAPSPNVPTTKTGANALAQQVAPSPAATPQPSVQSAAAATSVAGLATDAPIAAERRLSNPALKRSSFSLGALLGSFSKGSGGSRRSGSFSGGEGAAAGGSGGGSAASSRQPSPGRSADASPASYLPRDGRGLAALLRGAHAVVPASTTGAATRATAATPASAIISERAIAERCAEVVERSRLDTAALTAKLAELSASPELAPHSSPAETVAGDLERISRERRNRQEQGKHGLSPGHGGAGDPAVVAQLLSDWRSMLERREPLCMRTTAEERAALRAAAEKQSKPTPPSQEEQEEAQNVQEHNRLQRQRSTVPDPLYGLTIHHLSRRASRRDLVSPTSGSVHSLPDVQRQASENTFYSELELALGVRFAGTLDRVVTGLWRRHYFVLIAEPAVNPNLRLPPPVKVVDPAVPAVPAPAHDQAEGGTEAAATPAEQPTLFPLPPPALQHPAYYLMEYAKCAPSKWGQVPVQLLRRYPLRDILALRTDSRPSKKGLEFSIHFLRPAPAAANNAPSENAPAGHEGAAAVCGQAIPPPAPVHSTLKDVVKKSRPGGRFADIVAKSKAAAEAPQVTAAAHPAGPPSPPAQDNTAAATASAAPKTAAGTNSVLGSSPSVDDPAPVPPSGPAAAAAAESTDAAHATSAAPAATALTAPEQQDEEPPVVQTRWNRLFKKSAAAAVEAKLGGTDPAAQAAQPAQPPSQSQPQPVASAPDAATAPSAPPPAASAPPAGPVAMDLHHTYNTGRGSPHSTVDPDGVGSERNSERLGDRDREEESQEQEDWAASDHDSELLEDEGEGDYYYRPGTFAGTSQGGRQLVGRRDVLKLRLRAPTPGDRLQWVQILHSVAAPSTYTNTTDY